jgi:exopolysaccharide biosynthesis protein
MLNQQYTLPPKDQIKLTLPPDTKKYNAVLKNAVFATPQQLQNATYLKLSTTEKSVQAYSSVVGESDFSASQRFSNFLNIYNVICETYDGNILFVLVEGRGYNSPGLDRAQLTSFISLLNVKHAVALDGGFSGNILICKTPGDATQREYLLNDPEKRKLGVSLHFLYE